MSMSRKDYEAFARMLRRTRQSDHLDPVLEIEDWMVDYFADDNPRFDEARFREAARA